MNLRAAGCAARECAQRAWRAGPGLMASAARGAPVLSMARAHQASLTTAV